MSYFPGFYLDKIQGLHLCLSSNGWRGVKVPSQVVGERGTSGSRRGPSGVLEGN